MGASKSGAGADEGMRQAASSCSPEPLSAFDAAVANAQPAPAGAPETAPAGAPETAPAGAPETAPAGAAETASGDPELPTIVEYSLEPDPISDPIPNPTYKEAAEGPSGSPDSRRAEEEVFAEAVPAGQPCYDPEAPWHSGPYASQYGAGACAEWGPYGPRAASGACGSVQGFQQVAFPSFAWQSTLPTAAMGTFPAAGAAAWPASGNVPAAGAGAYPAPAAGACTTTGEYSAAGHPQAGAYPSAGAGCSQPGVHSAAGAAYAPRFGAAAFPAMGTFSSAGAGAWPAMGNVPMTGAAAWPGMGNLPVSGPGAYSGTGAWPAMGNVPVAGAGAWPAGGNVPMASVAPMGLPAPMQAGFPAPGAAGFPQAPMPFPPGAYPVPYPYPASYAQANYIQNVSPVAPCLAASPCNQLAPALGAPAGAGCPVAGALASGALGAAPALSPAAAAPAAPAPRTFRQSAANMLTNVALVVALVLVVAMMFGGASGMPVSIAGYSWATVLTDSMSEVYPRGSLVVAQKVPSDSVRVGDDIMFMAGPETSCTHRVVEVVTNQGVRAFRTQGTSNPKPDAELVYPENLIGRVVWSSVPVGAALTIIRDNWPYIIFLLACACVLKFVISRIYAKDEEPAGAPAAPGPAAQAAQAAQGAQGFARGAAARNPIGTSPLGRGGAAPPAGAARRWGRAGRARRGRDPAKGVVAGNT